MHYYSSFKFQHIHINTCINCVSASPTHNYNIVINVHITSNNYIYRYSCRPEVNIQPWEIERQSIEEGASKTQWRKRLPKAFWKGNVFMGEGTRMELTKCNTDVAEILIQVCMSM